MKVDHSIDILEVGLGVLAIGGSFHKFMLTWIGDQGHLTVYDLSTKQIIFSKRISLSINNGIHMRMCMGGPHLFVSSNDCDIKGFIPLL